MTGKTRILGAIRDYKNVTLSTPSALALLCLAAFITRLLPLSISQYPFNNDSLTVCGISSDIMSSHHLTFPETSPWHDSHGVQTPIFSLLISCFASALGATPLQCAQFVDAVLAVLTVGGVYLLAESIIGSPRGGLIAGFMAVLMGTFVFTTASVWNEALGISLLVLALATFVRRGQSTFRVLTFAILMVLPLVHHVVTAIGLLTFAYLLAWSLFFAFVNGNFRKRHVADILLIGVPTIWAISYYSTVSFDRLSDISAPIKLMLLVSCFALLSLASVWILLLRTHSKWTFAPIMGIGLFLLLLVDYLGLVFPYVQSRSSYYLLLAAASSFLFAAAWYGAEVIIETRPMNRAVQLGLVLSPLTLIAFGLMEGFSLKSHQIVYRTFDFLDIFIFVGVGAFLCAVQSRHKRLYPFIGVAVVVSLLVSFPVAYAGEQLVGVRHDTQAYEVDGLDWIDTHTNSTMVISDERVSFIGQSMFGFVKNSGLPFLIRDDAAISPEWVCLVEDRWNTVGVNAYPEGTIVVPDANFTRVLSAVNVFYVGGPSDDRAIAFVGSEIGQLAMS